MIWRRLLIMVLGAVFVCQSGTTIAQPVSTDELRTYLYQTAPYPEWQDATIWCESRWLPWVTNADSGAAGLAQYLPSTWAWGEETYGIYGSPYDPYTAIDMMNAMWRDGLWFWWECA